MLTILAVAAALIAVGLYFGLKQKKEPPIRVAVPDKMEPPSLPMASPEGPKPRPAPPATVTPMPAGPSINGTATGVVGIGDPGDEVGDPVLARRVNIARSGFWIQPGDQLFAPGDPASFLAKLVDDAGNPVAGVPCVFYRAQGNLKLAGPVVSDANGHALASYTVTEDDMVGIDDPEGIPDSGSWKIVVYAGGRLLRMYKLLHDVR